MTVERISALWIACFYPCLCYSPSPLQLQSKSTDTHTVRVMLFDDGALKQEKKKNSIWLPIDCFLSFFSDTTPGGVDGPQQSTRSRFERHTLANSPQSERSRRPGTWGCTCLRGQARSCWAAWSDTPPWCTSRLRPPSRRPVRLFRALTVRRLNRGWRPRERPRPPTDSQTA